MNIKPVKILKPKNASILKTFTARELADTRPEFKGPIGTTKTAMIKPLGVGVKAHWSGK